MKTTLQAWGIGQGVRLPKSLIAALGLENGAVMEVELTPEKDAILVKPLLADVFVAAAAVADWRVDLAASQKIKKEAGDAPPALRFLENPDILAEVAASQRARSGALFCVGFAAESENLLAHAQAKRLRKNVPLLVGNIGPDTFGQDDNALLLVDESGHRELARASKADLARELIHDLAARLGPKAP